jgi:hypothetical protein
VFFERGIEIAMGVFLYRKSGFRQEIKISDMGLWLVEVDQDTNFAALGWLENGVQKTNDIEFGKLAFLRMK